MTMLVAINYIFKAVEINRSLKDLPSAAVTKALMQTGSTFIILCNTCVYDLCQSLLMATASTKKWVFYSMLGMTRQNFTSANSD